MAITDKSLEKAGLSVKCVLLTDKSSKISCLSVNLNEIFAELVEQRRLFKKMLCLSFLSQSSD